jgi:hypothetical protein
MSPKEKHYSYPTLLNGVRFGKFSRARPKQGRILVFLVEARLRLDPFSKGAETETSYSTTSLSISFASRSRLLKGNALRSLSVPSPLHIWL